MEINDPYYEKIVKFWKWFLSFLHLHQLESVISGCPLLSHCDTLVLTLSSVHNPCQLFLLISVMKKESLRADMR